MTGLIFASALLVVLLCWVRLSTRDTATLPALGIVITLALIPPVLFGSVVAMAFFQAPAGEYRVALEAVSFHLDDGDSATVGGGVDGDDADDFIIRGLPPAYLTFQRRGDTITVDLPSELEADADTPNYAVVRVDDSKPFANAVLLDNNTTINGVLFQREARSFTGGGVTYPRIEERRQELWTGGPSVRILRNLTAETLMYPLRFWARPHGAEDPATDARGAPLGSFFSFEGSFLRKSLYLTLVGDGTRVQNGAVYQRRVAEIPNRASKHFALYRLDYGDPLRDADAHSSAQERRSFAASFDQGQLRFTFDTPDIYRLSSESIAGLLARREKEETSDSFLLTTRDPHRNAPVAPNQMTLSFPQLGPRILDEFYSAIRVEGTTTCDVRVTTHTGARCYGFGDAFAIGDDAQAVLRLTKMRVPWGILLTLTALALLSIAWPFTAEQTTAATIIISAAETLLAIRLLIAFEGSLLDPSSASALWESLVACAVLPFALRIASLVNHKSVTTARKIWTTMGFGIAIAAIVGLTLWHARIAASSIVQVVFVVVFVIPPGLAWLTSWVVRKWTRPVGGRALVKVCLFGLAIAAVRVVMWIGAGWKERITLFNLDLAISVIYLPVMLLFFALVWQRYANSNAALRWKDRVVGCLAFGIGMLLTAGLPYAVRDSGSVFTHQPAVLLLFALPFLTRRPTWRTFAIGVWLPLLLAGHLFLLFYPSLRHLRGADEVLEASKTPEYRAALTDQAEAEKFLTARLRATTNELRVWSHISPQQLEQAGTSKAEGLVAQRRMLDRYGGRGLFGAGYLHVPLAVFRGTHLNDNLSAMHLLAPFGLAGGLMVVGLLLALALLPLYATLKPSFSATGDAANLWTPVLDRLEQRIGRSEYRTWFARTNFVGRTGDTITVSVPSQHHANRIREEYSQQVYSILDAVGPAGITLHLTPDTPERALDTRTALSTLALWTFSFVGLYMFAANLGLVLFTGKNVYLLAAASKSDVLEGGILLLIALVGLEERPAEVIAPAGEPVTVLTRREQDTQSSLEAQQ